MGGFSLNKEAVVAAFSLKAKEFAKDSANIFWLRDIKLPDHVGGHNGQAFVPDEKELFLFCESLALTLVKNFELDLSSDTRSLYVSLSSGRVSVYLRVAPLDQDVDESPVVVDMGFLLAVSPPTLMPVEAFAIIPSGES